MVAATAARGLTAADLTTIRTTVTAGRKPKVVFTEAAGQIAGQVGQVVDLLDPATNDEWVVVRFGRDELPFSPADLAMAPKTPVKRVPKTVEAPPPPATEPEPDPSDEQVAVPAPQYQEVSMPTPSAKASTVDTAPPAPEPAAELKPVRKTVARQPKPKPTPSLTVTIAYTEGEWTVAAVQGSKALAKPYLIKASEALALVGMLDVPGVHEAVEHIVDAERSETQAHAERLRAELAEIEARLADLPTAR